MKIKSIVFFCLCFGLLSGVTLLLGPSTVGAQIIDDGDKKGRVNPPGYAQDPELYTLSAKWNVTECCGWTGKWTRRPNTLIYDASWRHTNGTVVTGVIHLSSWYKATGVVTFTREDNHGTYRANLDASHQKLQQGTASWYPAGQGWSAVASN